MSINQDFQLESNPSCNNGPWNSEESLKYLIFLDHNKVIMSSKLKKKKFKVFDRMGVFIKSRTSLQCRSHHQKAIQKFKNIKKIIFQGKVQLKAIDYKNMFKEAKDQAKINVREQNAQPSNNSSLESYQIQKQNREKIAQIQPNTPSMGPILYSQMPNFIGNYGTPFYSFIPTSDHQLMFQNFYFYPNFAAN